MDRIAVEVRFSPPVQTDPGAHPASYTIGTGSFPVVDGFGGLVVSMLASGTQFALDFSDVKILSMPSSGGEVKESVPHVPALRHVKEPSNLSELRIAS